jgi:hypothetical protein
MVASPSTPAASPSTHAAMPTLNAAPALPPPNLTFHEKLEGPNYLSWLTQFSPILRSQEAMGIVDGTDTCPPQFIADVNGNQIPNPEFTIWQRKDQTILSWINITLSRKVLSTIYGLDTSRQVWSALANQFANQSKTRIANLRKQLQSLNQGSKNCTDYIQSAKECSDQLAAVGKPIPDEELITYLINGLSPLYNSFITTISIMTRDKQLTFEDFQDELLNHEILLNQQQAKNVDPNTGTFALFNQKQGSRPFHSRYRGYQGPKSNHPRNFGSRFNAVSPTPRYNVVPPPARYSTPARFPSPYTQPAGDSKNHFTTGSRTPCQICGKTSHQALDCFHRMDYSFQGRRPPSQLQAMVAQSAYADQEWYADSAANAHITPDLDNLTIQQPLQTSDAVGVGNGSTLAIANSGSTTFHSHKTDFHLKNVLHCPKAAANLISIQQFCNDNDCYFILTATHFYIFDLQTHKILLQGRSENGMYPLRFGEKSHRGNKAFTAMLGIKTSSLVWHFRLGHPSSDVVTRVVQGNNLPLSHSDFNKSVICSSCQLGKGKKLSFYASTRISSSPLELIHTDLWTSPVLSISGYKYYIVFVDDYSRFTWIYPLHTKAEMFETFVKFKLLVENSFTTKIKHLQSDGGGEFTSRIFQSFLTNHGIGYRKTCPYTSPQNGIAERKLRHI